MVRFRLILILLVLSRTGCVKGNTETCDRYKTTANVAVDPKTCVKPEFVTDKISRTQCVQKCSRMAQCTGVAVENFQHSSWCCFFTENPIGIKSGSNVLIHKPEVQTGCLFGFDPETNCTQCLSTQRYNFKYKWADSREPLSDHIDIVLSGDLCAEIGGKVLTTFDIVSGELDRGKRTWTFNTDIGAKLRATLQNGNMVNGIGYTPVNGAFTFTATATN